jgi:toxin ParE1/3/4
VKLKWTRLALLDMQHLHDYVAEDNPAAAGQMVSRISDAVQNLNKHPRMGREGRCRGTRELILARTPYIIVYVLEANEIQIVAVIHNSMRWPDAFSREDL